MKFVDKEHEDFYEECIKLARVKDDPQRKAYFYLMGTMKKIRDKFKSLYDLKKNCLKVEGLKQSWQTSTSKKVCYLAVNLFNGYTDEDNLTPNDIFNCDLIEYMLVALQIRFMH